MELTNLIFNILILVGIILMLYFQFYVPSYLKKKGENLATKEDIAQITKEIKEVETKFKVRESGEIDYNSLKRSKILEYFSAINNWQRLITDSSSDFSDNYEVKNELTINNIKEAKTNYNFKEGEIEIFISDSEFYHLRKDLSVKILMLQFDFEKHCLNISTIIKTELDLTPRYEKLLIERKNYQEEVVKKLRDLMPNRNKLIEYLDKLIKESLK